MKVFLDDVRIPSEIHGEGADEEWEVVTTIEEVFELLKKCCVTHLSLDNDLGHGYKEGHLVIPWLMEHGFWPTEEIFVHTKNSYWAPRMKHDIDRYFYGCVKPQLKRE
jgi:hypothetical protein